MIWGRVKGQPKWQRGEVVECADGRTARDVERREFLRASCHRTRIRPLEVNNNQTEPKDKVSFHLSPLAGLIGVCIPHLVYKVWNLIPIL